MLCFPQLATGAVAQFPCTKTVIQRTVVNQELDGGRVKLFDPGSCRVEWQLKFAGLTSDEWGAIEQLFNTSEGQLGSFCFLDPFGNLLCWSEELSAAAWTHDPAIQITDGLADPLGGSGATRVTNTGAAEQSLSQTAGVPGSYQYCLSVHARSDAASSFRLFATAGTSSTTRTYATGPQWSRVELPAAMGAAADSITFGAAIPAGAAVELFGFQVEAQRGASKYKATTIQSGVFANASFVDDELKMTSNALGEYSAAVRISAVK
jgi:hypothetical protein